MTKETKAALQDLLTIRALGEIHPVRFQQWQVAARELLEAEAPAKPSKPAADPK